MLELFTDVAQEAAGLCVTFEDRVLGRLPKALSVQLEQF